MEWLALFDEQLARMAQRDEKLAPNFVGLFASDRLPSSPHRDRPQAESIQSSRLRAKQSSCQSMVKMKK